MWFMKNKLLGFYLDAVVANIFFFLPIYSILFYESLGLSFSQIGFLIALIPLFNLIFEIPTGIFADKYGRKNSTLLGYTIMGCAYLLIFFYHSFWFLVATNMLIGFGVTFVTGAMDSWKSDLVSKKTLHSFFSTMGSLDSVG